MSGFSAEWLAAREPWDRRARAPDLAALLADWARGRRAANGGRFRALDLGCGTGASIRALDAALGGPVEWRLADADAALLAIAAQVRPAHPRSRVETTRIDLAAADLDALAAGADLLAASALLDLVSRDWLARLWEAARGRRSAILAGLNYDGRIALAPPHPLDATVRDGANRHQARDKGFGPALGPRAAAALAGMARGGGWRVRVRRSDWRLDARRDGPGLAMLLEGWAAAAREAGAAPPGALAGWLEDRRAAPGLRVLVGHRDVLALPPVPPPRGRSRTGCPRPAGRSAPAAATPRPPARPGEAPAPAGRSRGPAGRP